MTSTSRQTLTAELDQLIEKHHLLQHPFYQAWTEGTLSRESLALYAEQYYKHVEAFPEHLRKLAGRCDEEQSTLRDLVEENLAEELDPSAPHPKLWRDFAAAVGVDEATVLAAKPLPGLRKLVDTYDELMESASFTEAVATLYAYEAQVPEIATQKISGLRKNYGVTNAKGLAYFGVHEEADVRHRAAWRGWLDKQDDTDQEAVLNSVERALKALWGALDAVHSGPACALPKS